jgi:hypothetical protein
MHIAEPEDTRQIIYPAAIFVIVGMHRSAKDDIFTGDVLDSAIEVPATFIEISSEAETQDYSMDALPKASPSVSHSDSREMAKDAPPS